MDKIKRYFKPDQISQLKVQRGVEDLVVDDVDESELTQGENDKRLDSVPMIHPFPIITGTKKSREKIEPLVMMPPPVTPRKLVSTPASLDMASSRMSLNSSRATTMDSRQSIIKSSLNLRNESSMMNNESVSEAMKVKFTMRPLHAETTKKLRLLLFGNSTQLFNDSWRKQAIKLSDMNGQNYALIQTEQDPSGFLSGIQAYILIEIISTYDLSKFPPSLTSTEKTRLLACAISKILVKCANGGKLLLAILNTKVPVSLMNLNKSDCMENLDVLEFESSDHLQEYLIENSHLFESKMISASILILISIILTRDIDRATKDMDKPSNTLLNPNSQHCSNELLNLLMQGRAVSNFFNDSDSSNITGASKKGPKERNEIGFLSCSDKIGSYYTTPKWPVWLVRLENHIGLVFSLKKEILNDWKAECVFNMFFIELFSAKPELLIRRLTIYNRQFEVKLTNLDDCTPFIETVLLTKWKDATIEWF